MCSIYFPLHYFAAIYEVDDFKGILQKTGGWLQVQVKSEFSDPDTYQRFLKHWWMLNLVW